MIRTINIKSDGSFEVNFGSYETCGFVEDVVFPNDFTNKLSEIQSAILSGGFSEIHIEVDEFRSFEHLRSATLVSENSFGTTVSQEDFDWIMQQREAVDLALNPPQPETETDLIDPDLPVT